MASSDPLFLRTALRRFLIGGYIVVATPLLAIAAFGSTVAVVRSIGVPVRLITGIL
jgi:hypothetical protein